MTPCTCGRTPESSYEKLQDSLKRRKAEAANSVVLVIHDTLRRERAFGFHGGLICAGSFARRVRREPGGCVAGYFPAEKDPGLHLHFGIWYIFIWYLSFVQPLFGTHALATETSIVLDKMCSFRVLTCEILLLVQ